MHGNVEAMKQINLDSKRQVRPLVHRAIGNCISRFAWLPWRIFGILWIGVSVCNPMPLWSQDRFDPQIDAAAMQAINPDIPQPFSIDPTKVSDNGIEVFPGKHIVVYTDLRDEERVQQLVLAFDAAVPQWCEKFQIDLARAGSWKIRAFLIASQADLSRFEKSGLTPDLPNFAAGFQRDHNFWFVAQPGPYYTRHLMLHEGTHAFMQWFTGGYGAPWYSEGNAELIGVHRWQDADEPTANRLSLGYRLQDRTEAEYWGRVTSIQRDKAKGQAMSIQDMLDIPANAFRDVRYYAWSWAGCEFLSKHHLTMDSYRRMRSHTRLDAIEFNGRFQKFLQEQNVDWKRVEDDWTLFIDEIDYGHSIERAALSSLTRSNETQIQVASDRGWQVSDIEVKKGQRFKFSAKGRFNLGKLKINSNGDQSQTNGREPESFEIQSEANGVTLFYYRGRPLGELQLGIWNPNAVDSQSRTAGLIEFQPIGLQKSIEFDRDGILCFRVNESPAKLGDNQGTLEVTLERLE